METNKIKTDNYFDDLNSLIISVVPEKEIFALSNIQVFLRSRHLKKILTFILIIVGIGFFKAATDKIFSYFFKEIFTSVSIPQGLTLIGIFLGIVFWVWATFIYERIENVVVLTKTKILIIKGIKSVSNKYSANEVVIIPINEVTKCSKNPFTFKRLYKLRTSESNIYLEQSLFWINPKESNKKFVELNEFIKCIKDIDKYAYENHFREPHVTLFFKASLRIVFIIYSILITVFPFYTIYYFAKLKQELAITAERERRKSNYNSRYYNREPIRQRKYPFENNKGLFKHGLSSKEIREMKKKHNDNIKDQSPNIGSSKSFTICNQSSKKKVYVSICYFKDNAWITEGWWHIEVGDCNKILSEHNGEYVLLCASLDGNYWIGEHQICTNTSKAFKLNNRPGSCPVGYEKLGYRQIKVSNTDFEYILED